MWRSLVDCSNDRKSAAHEKGQCLEDYPQRFGHTESLRKNNAKTELNDNQKEIYMQMYQDIIERLQSELDSLRWVITDEEIDFWLRPGNQAPVEASVEVSDVTEIEESKRVKARSQSHAVHVRGIVHSEIISLQSYLQVYNHI